MNKKNYSVNEQYPLCIYTVPFPSTEPVIDLIESLQPVKSMVKFVGPGKLFVNLIGGLPTFKIIVILYFLVFFSYSLSHLKSGRLWSSCQNQNRRYCQCHPRCKHRSSCIPQELNLQTEPGCSSCLPPSSYYNRTAQSWSEQLGN